MSDNKSINVRARTWRAVFYPDSLPSNWKVLLEELNVPCCYSPLHDKDVDGDGEPKKAHYHVILYFRGKKSFEQVCALLEPFNCPIPKVGDDIEGAVRYLAHLDSPNKYQYSPSEIISLNGFDAGKYTKATTTSRYDYIADMLEFIAVHHITEFMDFCVFCKAKRFDTWYPLLCDNSALLIREAIKSNRHRSGAAFVDYDTGEILCEVSFDGDYPTNADSDIES